MCFDLECDFSRKPPMEVAERRLIGWTAFSKVAGYRHYGDFPSLSQAKAIVEKATDFPIEWRIDGRGLEAGDFNEPNAYIGMHYAVLRAIDESSGTSEVFRESYGTPPSKRATMEALNSKVKEARFHICPNLKCIMRPIAGAVWAFDESDFYIYPKDGQWRLARQGGEWDSKLALANYKSKEEALSEARRKSLGIPNKFEIARKKEVAFGFSLLFICIILYTSIAFNFGTVGFISCTAIFAAIWILFRNISKPSTVPPKDASSG